MLSERVRRALLGELVEAANLLLRSITGNDAASRALAIANASAARASLSDGYECPESRVFNEIESCFNVVASGAPTPSDLKKLREALDGALGFLNPLFANARSWRARYYGASVRLTHWGEPQRQTLEVSAKDLCERFGKRLVAALFKVMAGVNRLSALLDFIALNEAHVRDDSVASWRNFQSAALETFAYLKEIAETIDELNGSGIKRVLRDQDPWNQLKALQREWRGAHPTAVRNQVMFHFGDLDQIEKQLDLQVTANENLPLYDSDVDGVGALANFTAAQMVVMSACGLSLSDYGAIAERAVASYGPLLTSVTRIMDDLLRQCGARLPPLEIQQMSLLKREKKNK